MPLVVRRAIDGYSNPMLGLAVFLLVSSPALAAPLDCFTAGGDAEVRLAACDEAIVDSELSDAIRARAYLARADVRQQARDVGGALADIEAALDLGGGDTAARLTRTRLLTMLGRTDDALDALDLVIGADPGSSEAFTLRADILFSRGDPGPYLVAAAPFCAPAPPRPPSGSWNRRWPWTPTTASA